MNKAKLKSYAPGARRDFIRAVTDRAYQLGITETGTEPATVQGEVTLIGGRAFGKELYAVREKLVARIAAEGFAQTMEQAAYNWFNRFCALRFMEINNYLPHGFRVLSNQAAGNTQPEILEAAAQVELAGLDKAKVLELKLAGDKDAELYRLLIIAQCNALHDAMPFLFERINDETELLLPGNLLNSDSLIRRLVRAIDEADWHAVEIIGWLYQFYISERKDEVIGKVVASADIPAATQLFTPNWIVKYMVQNSLGRLWMNANPSSPLKAKMEFYVEPKDADAKHRDSSISDFSFLPSPFSLNLEQLKILDPACGSGHILVEAYDLLKEMYLERGYRTREIPRLILKHNLFGLDIDTRAAQLAGFALMMKARADDRRILEVMSAERGVMSDERRVMSDESRVMSENEISSDSSLTTHHSSLTTHHSSLLNVLAIESSAQMDAEGLARALSVGKRFKPAPEPIIADKHLFADFARQGVLRVESDVRHGFAPSDASEGRQTPGNAVSGDGATVNLAATVRALIENFQAAETLGSLVTVTGEVAGGLAALRVWCDEAERGTDLYRREAAAKLSPLIRQAEMLSASYDCVIANPPYMGGKGMNAELKAFAARAFPDSKADLFAMFIERNLKQIKPHGHAAFVTPFVWMFLSSYENFRKNLIEETPLTSLIQLEYNAFEPACVPVCTFTMKKNGNSKLKGEFIKLSDFKGHQNQAPRTLEAINNPNCGWRFSALNEDFKKIPGSPIAYWVSDKVREVFEKFPSIGNRAKKGLTTGDNERFLRLWHEVSKDKTSFGNGKKWFPSPKGGNFRKWFGNQEFVVNWENNGIEIKSFVDEKGKLRSVPRNTSFYFKQGITWNDISNSFFNARYVPENFISNASGPMIFGGDINSQLCFLNSTVNQLLLSFLAPTFHFEVGTVALVPMIENAPQSCQEIAKECVAIARADWDSFETSWDFASLPLLESRKEKLESRNEEPESVEEAWRGWERVCHERISRMQQLETENNRLFIEAYGLSEELSPEVPLSQITLARPDKEKDVRRLLSYFIGCLMGRYSLDAEGLIYADAQGTGFDPTRYGTFAADDDGIVPVTDTEWFSDDAAQQFERFVNVAFAGNARVSKRADDTEQGTLANARVSASLAENLTWIAAQLGAKSGEHPRDTIRRYFAAGFYKDHLQTYKKRPIYWLVSSGKERAFQCLFYLHRYHGNTLARMRTQYVTPLFGKLAARREFLDTEIAHAANTAARNRLQKDLDAIKCQHAELTGFDETLRHYIDLRPTLDLDDGVRRNYAKLAALLSDAKHIIGAKE